MNFQTMFAAAGDRKLRVGLIGVGEFGATLAAQARAIPRLHLAAFADRDPQRVLDVLAALGIARDAIVLCDTLAKAGAALAAGKIVISDDNAIVTDAPLDVVVEATGHPEGGAVNAERAILGGKHVVLVSKEADSVVGPYLARLARKQGVVCTPVEGDQPALLMGLVSWAQTLGLEIVALGKSSEYDFVYDPPHATLSWRERSIDVPWFGGLWTLDPKDPERTLAARAMALAALPQRTVPDYCEMCLVANATGFVPDTPRLHAPMARSIELPTILRLREQGGILGRKGAIEVFNCLRRGDEASFAGGVFVVVAGADRKTFQVLQGKGIPVDADHDHMLLYNPAHLLGVEAPMTILSAGLLARSSGPVEIRPVCDVVARATRPLAAGTMLTLDQRHAIEGVEAELVPARALDAVSPVPFYLAGWNRLARDVPAGALLTADMIERPSASPLWRMRAEQDRLFQAT